MRCLLELGLAETASQAPGSEQPASGDTTLPDFGSYHSVGVLGEGGMGIVYLAEQRQPIRRRVALKVLKRGDGGSSVAARFELESQALALMDHPNIAKVYDAGTIANGRPYFAMEYVPGIPITDYCDRNLLGFRERLDLFQKVCQAVQHAHQKGIIHRDLKPSNVLVMLQDGKPVPKIIDFGIAKALNQRLVEQTLFTEIGMLIGTPEYMSPEQAELTGLDIDSTTDIYSLGVLLYELLVGALPFDSRTLRKAGYGEIQRMIREEEPPKPSTRLSTMGQGAQEVARRRRSDVRTLTRLLRGDLEWIMMKALEKDRTRRYASASEFAADISRHLANEPVLAHAPAAGYLLRKFVRRHGRLVWAAAAVALALLAGAVVSFSLYLRATHEQQKAEIESYSANLVAADLQLSAGRAQDARVKLANTLPALRGWEWRHLMAATDQSVATIYSPEFGGMDVHVRSPELRFNEDGTQIFSYGGSFLRSWDLATKHIMTDLSDLGRILSIGPYGRTVLVGPQLFADPPVEGYILRLYDVRTRQVLSVLRGMDGDPGEAAISGDGVLVAVALDNSDIFKHHAAPVIVWNAHTGQITAHLEGHPTDVNSLRFSPDGRVLATGSADRTVQLWDLAASRKLRTFKPESRVTAISYSRDGGLLASGSADGTVCVWNTATGERQAKWKTDSYVYAVNFSPDNSVLATSSGSAIRLWDVRTGQLLQFLGGHTADALAFHPTAPRLYSSGTEIKEWDLSGHGSVIADAKESVRICVSANGKWLASGSRDGKVRIYDAESAKLLRAWDAHNDRIYAMALSPDSQVLATGSFDKTIKLWRLADGQLLRTLTGHKDRVWSVAFYPDGARLVSSSDDRTIRVWQTASDAPPFVIPTVVNTAVSVSHDGRLIMGLRQNDKAVLLWDAQTKQSLAALSSETTEGSPGQIRSFALSQNGQILVAPADTGSAIAIWNFQKRELLRILPVLRDRGDNGFESIAISPDGSRAAVGAENTGSLSVWDLQKGQLLVTLSGHSRGITSLVWSPDGTRLFSSSYDGTIRIWDSRSPHNFEAELLLESLSDSCLLVEEVTQELNADRTISPELRRAAIELANQRGNAAPPTLIQEAVVITSRRDRSVAEFQRGLRLASAGVQSLPWYGFGHTILGLLQYRMADFDKAILSAGRALELSRDDAPNAHAIRAMAYYKLHDSARAKDELRLGRAADAGANELLDEAQALISAQNASSPRQ